MSTLLKRILISAGGLALLGLLVAAGLAYRLAVDAKPRVQAIASDALGMDVAIGGRLTVGVLHGLHISLGDVRVRHCGVDVGSAGEVDLGIDALPLLRHEVRIGKLRLRELKINLERDRGRPPRTGPDCPARAEVPALSITTVILSDSSLRYTDADSGKTLAATGCGGQISDLALSAAGGAGAALNLSFAASGTCAQIGTPELAASDVAFAAHGVQGIIEVDPLRMRLLGGQGAGTVHADFSGAVPAYQVRYHLVQFRIEEVLKALSVASSGQGLLDFDAKLTLHGTGTDEWLRTLAGEASLRGTDLRLGIGDLDQRFARYESSQNFNLVDVGAIFFLGPVGLGITKGLAFARNLQGDNGSTTFHTLLSEWQVEHGVAHARDVAMATLRNRIALQGNLDFVTGRFADVTVALVDAKGCATVKQRVNGPFLAPQVEQPSVLKSLTGPTRRLLGQVRTLLGGKCEVFYAGSVGPPA
jgi:AsmA protein